MLKKIGLHLVQQRRYAIWVALICALLPFVGLPTFWVSILLVGLITLCKGPKEGFWLLLWVALPGLAWGFIGDLSLIIGVIALRALIVWFLATLLRRTASWSVVLCCAATLGIVGVAGLHIAVPEVTTWWQQQLAAYWTNIASSLNLAADSVQAQQMLKLTAQFASGILVVALMLADMALLLLARGWQAKLYNPGGLVKELLRIRLHYFATVILLLILVAAGLGSAIACDLLPVAMLPFVAAGLSLVHTQLSYKPELKLPVLITLYFALILFLPYVALLLVGIAMIDSGYNFRSLRAGPEIEVSKQRGSIE